MSERDKEKAKRKWGVSVKGERERGMDERMEG